MFAQKYSIAVSISVGLLSGLVVALMAINPFKELAKDSLRYFFQGISELTVMGGAGFFYGIITAPFFITIATLSVFRKKAWKFLAWVAVSGVSYVLSFSIGSTFEDTFLSERFLFAICGTIGAAVLLIGFHVVFKKLTFVIAVCGSVAGGLVASLVFDSPLLYIVWQTTLTVYIALMLKYINSYSNPWLK